MKDKIKSIDIIMAYAVAFSFLFTYMYTNSFFAYDMFTEGILGTMLFASISIAFMLLLSMMLFGSITFFVHILEEREKEQRANIFEDRNQQGIFIFVCVINIIFYISIVIYESDLLLISIYLMAVAVWISSFGNNRVRILFLFLTLVICCVFSNQISSIVSDSLKAFGVGGDIPTVIYTKNNQQESGKLKMITPRNVYIQQDNKSIITIIPIDNIEKIDNSIEVKKGII
jgi:hypothetical protein